MKTRRLSEIDLAKFASLSAGFQLEQALRGYEAGGGAWSYDPVRASTSDILGARTPLLGRLDDLTWGKIRWQIERSCKRGDAQVKANLEVGKALFDGVRKIGWSAVKFHMGRLPIGIGETVRYWSDVLLEDDHGVFIPFFDHRREHGIASRGAKQILFSMQHTWVRERYPDLAQARLALVRFPNGGASRSLNIEFHDEAQLMPFDELNEGVCTVYKTWARISHEKARESRRENGSQKTGTGGKTLFD